MNSLRNGWLVIVILVGALSVMPGSKALGDPGTLAPGNYRCSSYNVSGAGGSCAKMQPLLLHPDGSYQYSSTRGRWSVSVDTLLLSKSNFWGPGKIVGNNSIRFEYEYRGLHHVVTWVCQTCGPAKTKGTGAATAGSLIGVSLTLEFDSPVGGVSGFTIVPAEAAASYGHNGPLPEGAVQGLAWEKSRSKVALATNRNNKLRSGRRYVVFLSWPRETIPVAILDLPSVTADYSTTLRATLDGVSVLSQAGTL